jgi:hypothetical protein
MTIQLVDNVSVSVIESSKALTTIDAPQLVTSLTVDELVEVIEKRMDGEAIKHDFL